jgi:hypothetical protein
MQVGDARFDAPSAYTVSLDRHETTRSIAVNAGSVTIDFNGHTLTSLLGTTVADGATFGGAGTIVGDLALVDGAALSPGASPGTLHVDGRLSLAATTVAAFDLNGADATVGNGVNDFVTTGDLTLDGVLNIIETPPQSFSSASLGDHWQLFSYTGALVNKGLTLGSVPTLADPTWRFVIDASTAGQVNLRITTIPEPSTTILVALPWLAAEILRRRHLRSEPAWRLFFAVATR